MLSSDEILTGLGLVIVLGLACRLVAHATRLPVIMVLLPVGGTAGRPPVSRPGDTMICLRTPG